MLVVDTSAVFAALAGEPPVPELVDRLATGGELGAPHLVDVEMLHALRRQVRRGEMSIDHATDLRTDFADLALTRYPHEPLSDRIWELRENLSAYDASFVALAEILGVPLVTCDAALASTPGVSHLAELFEPYTS